MQLTVHPGASAATDNVVVLVFLFGDYIISYPTDPVHHSAMHISYGRTPDSCRPSGAVCNCVSLPANANPIRTNEQMHHSLRWVGKVGWKGVARWNACMHFHFMCQWCVLIWLFSIYVKPMLGIGVVWVRMWIAHRHTQRQGNDFAAAGCWQFPSWWWW